MERELTLRIILEQPPPGVDFGLQKGSGRLYETVQKQRSTTEDLHFELTVEVKTGRLSQPDFRGPFVQGPAGGRFLYIDIGTLAGQTETCWSRRMKIPLGGIGWDMIDSKTVLETRVPGAGRDGGPACGAVKPVDGWKATGLAGGF